MYASAMRRSWWMMSIAVALCASGAWAQASFIESFDSNGAVSTGQYGPANLIARGWTFRMQSSPASTQAFFDGYHGSGWPAPQNGPGYLAADAVLGSAGSGPVSHWAILPAIPNQVAGDRVTLHVRRLGALPARLEVRYSPSGGTGTGSGPTAVGDFTQLLVNIDPVPVGAWLAYSAAVPGAGRIALRFAGQYQSFSGGMYSGIDTLSVGTPPPPPCNLPPAPTPGQSAVWTRAGSPYRICTDLLVPPGASVTVEPGVTVNVDPGKSLVIDGRVTAHGTPTLPITFNGGISTAPPPVHVPNGTLDLAFGVVTCSLRGGPGTTLLIADSTFSGQGSLGTIETITLDRNRYSYTQVDRGTFGPGGISVTDGTLVVRDSTFNGGSVGVTRGALWVSNVSIDGGIIGWTRERPGQSALIDTVSIRNNPSLPALRLDGRQLLPRPGQYPPAKPLSRGDQRGPAPRDDPSPRGQYEQLHPRGPRVPASSSGPTSTSRTSSRASTPRGRSASSPGPSSASSQTPSGPSAAARASSPKACRMLPSPSRPSPPASPGRASRSIRTTTCLASRTASSAAPG